MSVSTQFREGARACLTALEGHDDMLRDWLVSEKWLLDRSSQPCCDIPDGSKSIRRDLQTRLPQYNSVLKRDSCYTFRRICSPGK